jgi:hypothetical protein
MDNGECTDNRFNASALAWRMFRQDRLVELRHQSWNLAGRREWEVVLDEIDLPIFPGPRVNRAKPDSMNLADIVCRESMVPIVAIDQLRHCAQLFHQLGSVHLAFAGDAEEIPKNAAA